jgi:hypothetical protein
MLLLQHRLQNILPQPQPFTKHPACNCVAKAGGTLPLDANMLLLHAGPHRTLGIRLTAAPYLTAT